MFWMFHFHLRKFTSSSCRFLGKYSNNLSFIISVQLTPYETDLFWPQSFRVLKSPQEDDTESEVSMSRQSQVSCYSPSESEESFKKKPAKKSRTEETDSYKCSHCSYAELIGILLKVIVR